jgi:hypothetical protein
MVIDLPKSGYSVTFKDYMPQRAFEAYLRELSNGLNPREVSSGVILNDRIDYATVDAAVRAALPYVVLKISKEGKDSNFSNNWALDISKADFSLLATEVTRLKEEEERLQAEGKKNNAGNGAVAVDEGAKSDA